MKDHLAKLLDTGAVITLPRLGGTRSVLAAAAIADELWFFPIFGDRGHFIAFDRTEQDGAFINLFQDKELVATVGPLELQEDRAELARWEDYLKTPDGQAVAESIAFEQSNEDFSNPINERTSK